MTDHEVLELEADPTKYVFDSETSLEGHRLDDAEETEGRKYYREFTEKPWILSPRYYSDKSPTIDEIVKHPHMGSWLTFLDE